MNNIEKLINKYIEAAILHGIATEEGKYNIVNQQYNIVKNIYYKLKNNPNYGLKSLIPLLDNPNDFVRLTAAAQTLSIEPKKAEKVLLELSEKPRFLGYNAKMTLEEWRKKGELKF